MSCLLYYIIFIYIKKILVEFTYVTNFKLKYFSIGHPNVLNGVVADFYVADESAKDGKNSFNFGN